MTSSIFSIRGKINGEKQVSFMLGYAGKRIMSSLRGWMRRERARFVGVKRRNKLGTFTRSVARRKLRGRSGTYSKRVVRAFGGVVTGSRTGNNELRMGLLGRVTGFRKGIEDLQTGYTRRSSRFMPIPVVDNLEKIGVTKNYSQTLHSMIASDEIVTIRTGGVLLFVSQELIDSGSNVHEATVYIGTKRTRVKRVNFGMVEKWAKAQAGVTKRGRNAVDRVIRGINKGYIKPR